MNEQLLKRMQQLIDNTTSEGLPYISSTMEQLRIAVPDFQGKQFKDGEQPSQDHVSGDSFAPAPRPTIVRAITGEVRQWTSY